jgi:hypothetical protein
LQSGRQSELFDELFVNCDPNYLRECQALLTLSVGAAISTTLENNTAARLDWLEVILGLIDPMVYILSNYKHCATQPTNASQQDPETRQVSTKIMNVLVQRLESEYMHLAEENSQNSLLRRIPPLTRRAREIAAISRQFAVSEASGSQA